MQQSPAAYNEFHSEPEYFISFFHLLLLHDKTDIIWYQKAQKVFWQFCTS